MVMASTLCTKSRARMPKLIPRDHEGNIVSDFACEMPVSTIDVLVIMLSRKHSGSAARHEFG